MTVLAEALKQVVKPARFTPPRLQTLPSSVASRRYNIHPRCRLRSEFTIGKLATALSACKRGWRT
ncbi:hypothetical protein ebA516 [Aromatoleum aromaticum EbN1]|uniref:Uncharacterized protein n=1 Tax=Aromatoleum aromaticum (strain DSM 19018 / LMG 30748 / EbN1) TaxID=76114 RepID=Q5P8H4_AROAE|nr:hypothetical protein ebA516 [Aromatoleum aromaticum EbN1]